MSATSAALGVLGTLATIVFVLPVFVKAGGSMQFSTLQVTVVGILCLALYAIFVFVQTIKHRDYFMEVGSFDPAPKTIRTASPPRRRLWPAFCCFRCRCCSSFCFQRCSRTHWMMRSLQPVCRKPLSVS